MVGKECRNGLDHNPRPGADAENRDSVKTERIPFAEPVTTDAAIPPPAEMTGTFEPVLDTTSLDALIFKEDEVRKNSIRLDADPSLDFRRKLDISGNKYQIERLIGTGGFSQVFLAKDRVLGRKAVVKSLKRDLLADNDTVQKFITEAKLNAQLDHPSIVALYS